MISIFWVGAWRVHADDVDVQFAATAGSKVNLFENVAHFMESDGDGVRDDVDCAPADATAFAVSGEVASVVFQMDPELRWDTTGPRSGTALVGEDDTVEGGAFYYLIRRSTACGTGSYGARSSGAERISLDCP